MLNGLTVLGTELAGRVADRAEIEMDAAQAVLNAALAAPPVAPPPLLPPPLPPPPLPQASAPPEAAPAAAEAIRPERPPGAGRVSDAPPALARRAAARLGPAAWNILFTLICREVCRLIALAEDIEAARRDGRPLRPSAEPAHDDRRRERVRALAREAAAADPGDRDLQDLLTRIDALLDEAPVLAGLAAGQAPAELAAALCAELGIAFGSQGPAPQDLAAARPAPGPDPP